MANPFKKILDYFATDDMGELEETDVAVTKKDKKVKQPLPKRDRAEESTKTPLVKAAQSKPVRPQVSSPERTKQDMQTPPVNRPKAPTSRPTRSPLLTTNSESNLGTESVAPWAGTGSQASTPSRPQAPSQPPRQQAASTVDSMTNTQEIRITIRYPQRYEDATTIVDLLLQNETILINFEYMDEAQARRCIDFLDGASRVLYGSLQRVGGTLYLLAPRNVVVTTEELRTVSSSQDLSYDYDMKRR